MLYSSDVFDIGKNKPRAPAIDTILFTQAATTPNTLALVPWGVACLALLMQRSSDKSAIVRAKALGSLAVLVADQARGDAAFVTDFRRVGIGLFPSCHQLAYY